MNVNLTDLHRRELDALIAMLKRNNRNCARWSNQAIIKNLMTNPKGIDNIINRNAVWTADLVSALAKSGIISGIPDQFITRDVVLTAALHVDAVTDDCLHNKNVMRLCHKLRECTPFDDRWVDAACILIKYQYHFCTSIPKEAWCKKLATTAVGIEGDLLCKIPSELRDYELCRLAVKNSSDGEAIGAVPAEWQDSLMDEALKATPHALTHASEEIRDKEKWQDRAIEAIKEDHDFRELIEHRVLPLTPALAAKAIDHPGRIEELAEVYPDGLSAILAAWIDSAPKDRFIG